ncbi:MAG: hypothetical protein HY906_09825 [Deltaproteobacteria bacterium]|nr:hypothetical protein [Deltaproteobacteria bacterium]
MTCPTGRICSSTACVSATCVAGETLCAGSPLFNAYRTCQGGLFTSQVTFCPSAGDAGVGLQWCVDTRDANNLRHAVCGLECVPGARRCEAVAEDAGLVSKLRICDATGKWGAATFCPYGDCTGNEPIAGCQADCLPGQVRCAGSTVSHPDMHLNVSTGAQSCTAAGLWDTAVTACTAGQYCRRNSSGVAYGCLECVGSSNEVGRLDVRCSSGTEVEECGSNNLWVTPPVSCNGTCTPANGGQPAYCPTMPGGACFACATSTCGTYRTACLADPACMTALESCLATYNCWNAASMWSCLHNFCWNTPDMTTPNYHNCLTSWFPPTGCYAGGCN